MVVRREEVREEHSQEIAQQINLLLSACVPEDSNVGFCNLFHSSFRSVEVRAR